MHGVAAPTNSPAVSRSAPPRLVPNLSRDARTLPGLASLVVISPEPMPHRRDVLRNSVSILAREWSHRTGFSAQRQLPHQRAISRTKNRRSEIVRPKDSVSDYSDA
jgi:hypothetical protein